MRKYGIVAVLAASVFMVATEVPVKTQSVVSWIDILTPNDGAIGNCVGKAHGIQWDWNRTLRSRILYQCIPPNGSVKETDANNEAANRKGICIVATSGNETCDPVWDSPINNDSGTEHVREIRGRNASIVAIPDTTPQDFECSTSGYDTFVLDGRKIFSNSIPECQTDDDGDGWSPPADCDDDDWDTKPGGNTDCTDTYMRTGDRDCSGQQDSDEYGTCPNCPIAVDVLGNGYRLTNQANGVMFDLNGDGGLAQIPWTAMGSDDAWLALDRNGNGVVDNGIELFGNFTPQPVGRSVLNGFEALKVFDQTDQGGNGDGWIDQRDLVFSNLKLWTDSNHDGVSQLSELHGLDSLRLRRLSLNYHEANRADQFGNWFRFRAVVLGGGARDIGPMAWDVFLGGRPAGRFGFAPPGR